MPVRGLTIVVATADGERFRTAVSLAAAHAALGGRTRLFCQADAVALLRSPVAGKRDAAHAAAGLPTLGQLLDEALSIGVELIACQSGLALHAIDLAELDPGVGAAGLVGLLAELGDDRLTIA